MKTNQELNQEAEECSSLATEMFNEIWEDAAMWMQLPQDFLGGVSPLKAIAEGKYPEVKSYLLKELGREK